MKFYVLQLIITINRVAQLYFWIVIYCTVDLENLFYGHFSTIPVDKYSGAFFRELLFLRGSHLGSFNSGASL